MTRRTYASVNLQRIYLWLTNSPRWWTYARFISKRYTPTSLLGWLLLWRACAICNESIVIYPTSLQPVVAMFLEYQHEELTLPFYVKSNSILLFAPKGLQWASIALNLAWSPCYHLTCNLQKTFQLTIKVVLGWYIWYITIK